MCINAIFLSVRDRACLLAVLLAGSLLCISSRADEPVSFSEEPRFLSPVAVERLSDVNVEPEEMPDEVPEDDVSVAAFLQKAEKGKKEESLGSVSKRLADLEKKYQKKEDAEKKKPEFPSHKITGFTQLDTAYYSQTPNNRATIGDAQDGTGFRRARLAVQGKVAEFTSYQLEMDFATAGRPSFFDNYIDQGNLPWGLGTIRLGQFCQPFSVDSLTGFRNLTFLERGLPFLAFVPFRRVGIASYNNTEDELTAWGISCFRTGGFNNAPLGDSRFATDIGDVGGYSFSGRITHLLTYDEPSDGRYLWHVGASYDFSELGANDALGSGLPGNAGSPKPFYQSRVLPEFGTLGFPENGGGFGNSTTGSAVNGTPIFVDSGRYQASSFNLMGLESVTQWGPWGFTAEVMGNEVNSAAGPVWYHGAYAFLAYRLTGENRVYDKRTGTLGKLNPYTEFIPLKDGICGWGAWEVAGRVSYVDIRNPAKLDGHYYNATTNTFNATSKAGNGQLMDTTFGLTWFLNRYTKMQFNWIHAMLDNTVRGKSSADLYVGRAQIDF